MLLDSLTVEPGDLEARTGWTASLPPVVAAGQKVLITSWASW
jgi:hypothetical protein